MKLLVFSIDGRGLGHLNRTLLLARSLRSQMPQLEACFLVESPAYRLVEQAGFEVLKLPDPMHPLGRYALKVSRARFEAELVARVAERVQPDVALIDFAVDLNLFATLRRQGCRVWLVLRKLRQPVMRDLVRDAACRHVDAFIVPHEPDEFAAGELPDSWLRRCHFTGALVRKIDLERVTSLREQHLSGAEQLVLVSLGGGGWSVASDLADCARRAIRSLRARWQQLQAVVVYGPLYDGEIPADEPGICGLKFEPELPELMAAADAVVCMAGYNSVRELLAAGSPGVLVPLESGSRDDQVERAKRLQKAGRALVAGLDADEIAAQLRVVLSGGGPRRRAPQTTGDELRAGRVLAALLHT